MAAITSPGRASSEPEAGYAVLDAAVAMFIFASMIVFALGAAHQSRRITGRALEIREANHLTQALFETYRTASGESEGRTADFRWTVSVGPPEKSSAASTICRHEVTLAALRSGRSYAASSEEICPVGDAP